MFSKKEKNKKRSVKRKVLKVILWLVGVFAIVIVVFFIRISFMFSSMPNRFERFWGKITDPCYEIYDNSVVIKGWPKYKIKNDRVCIYVQLNSWGGGFAGIKLISVQGADPNTFEVIYGYYSKDKNNVYYKNREIQGADPNTFELIDGRYGKDKNNKYLYGEKIKE